MAAGFERLLESADDLVLDCPDAVHLLALFTGRAIVDEVRLQLFELFLLQGSCRSLLGVGCSTMLTARSDALAL